MIPAKSLTFCLMSIDFKYSIRDLPFLRKVFYLKIKIIKRIIPIIKKFVYFKCIKKLKVYLTKELLSFATSEGSFNMFYYAAIKKVCGYFHYTAGTGLVGFDFF